ncbi:P-loop containing nucleoside triphosphate hydrolase protein [Daedalea quercina L-15889]|uniref:RNA helicase n=1 Tax=Daedalea quercina L-15889 TaxID=1314783 RepID=A0A165LHG6_9APHY|nr:P-loop containing nucleoside triphosphate hydrolase protein [Daedalea quercina L-15889]
MQAYDAHKQGEAHKRALTELAFASIPQGTSSGYVRCPICERDLPAARWDAHVERDQYHRKRQKYADVTTQVHSARLNRNGVSVTGEASGIDFGVIEADAVHGSSADQMMEVTVSNEVSGSLITLALIKFSSSYKRNSSSSFSAALRGASRFVNHGKPRTVVVTFHSSYVGRFEDVLEFEFHDVRRRERFVILRNVLAVVGPAADYDFLKAKGPYRRPPFVPHEPDPYAIPTARPPTWSKVRWAVKLPEFAIPDRLARTLNTADKRKILAEIRVHFLPNEFNIQTYCKFFSTLLHVEEFQQRLHIPGLTEGNPTLRVGDKLLVCKYEAAEVWHQAIVHEVQPEGVVLHINPKFSLRSSREPVNIRFQLNRMPWRRRHQAVALDDRQARLLFPAVEDASLLRHPTAADIDAFQFKDTSLVDNYEQKVVVSAITNAPPGSVPFVIFGPPGTGKTVTLVEAALQILKNNMVTRLLICAPTNNAANLLAFKLMSLGPSQLFRLNAIWQPIKPGLQETLKDFCMINGNRVYAIPDAETLKSFRVIVTTCVSAAVPYSLGIARGWFTHVFVDEAGQCSEPDSMIPLKLVAGPETNIVLAGDIKQLGPVIHSSIGRDLGLRHSYLERLSNMPVYDLSIYRGITIMKLIKHFRSHPAIIRFSNERFYENELRPSGDPGITHSMLRSTVLDGLNPEFPVIFHGVGGRDEQEEGSPSYFNIEEASLVAKYCDELISDRKVPIGAKDIGVISPYRAQGRKIRALLGRLSAQTEGLKVGSTEEFQGQERRVIIISTVRSNTAHALGDIRRRLGFVGDAQRFNVAITRARALLIVIGDPSILSLDGVWKEFLVYVKRNGGWRGKDSIHGSDPESDDGGDTTHAAARREVEELIQRLLSLTFEDTYGWTVPDPLVDDLGSEPDEEAYDDRPPEVED